MPIEKRFLLVEFAQAMERMMKIIEKTAKNIFENPGLTMLQIKALEQIKKYPGISGRNLADNLYLSASSVSQLIDRIYEQGLIRRETDTEDRRLVLMSLTKKGDEALKEMKDKHLEVLAGVTEFMTVEEIQRIIEIYNKTSERIEKNINSKQTSHEKNFVYR